MVLLAALLLQAPVLVAGESRELQEKEWRCLALSRTGKYLVVGAADRLHVLEAKSLAPVKELVLRWTAFGFDDEDQRLLVIGADVARFQTRDWSLEVQATLPDTEFADLPNLLREMKVGQLLTPGKAVVLPDLDFYYCTKDGGLTLGSIVDKKLSAKPIPLKTEHRISRILGLVHAHLIVALERDVKAGVVIRGGVYHLPGCASPFFSAEAGTVALVIGREESALYSPTTWKPVAAREGEKNSCAVVDAASGWVFVGGPQGLRAWHTNRFEVHVRLDAVPEGILQLALDGRRRTLFSVERDAVRRWTIRD